MTEPLQNNGAPTPSKSKSPPSLVRRLWLASVLVIPILIGFSTFALNRAYERGLDSAEYEALLSQIYALLAIAEPNESRLQMPLMMANPRFETPDSGLYARILDKNLDIVWQSNSLAASSVKFAPSSGISPGSIREHWQRADGKSYRSLSMATIWEIRGEDVVFSFEVLHAQDGKEKEIASYRSALLFWLGGMAVLLLALQIVITLWGLRPLKAIAHEIERIEKGESKQLHQQYPSEIQPVTTSLNKLLHSESQQRQRYKNSLGDLAHSLKTPLSVVRAQLDDNDKDRLVNEQIQRMSEIINHQLKRASAEVQTLYGPQTKLKPLTERLINALNKVYTDKHFDIQNEIAPSIEANIEQDDCFEVLGNIVENAFKYGESRIKLTANTNGNELLISISDDGPGIDSDHTSTLLKRGARADTQISGQGIGLAIAVDILSSYNGGLHISRSELGGANFQISLPVSCVSNTE